VKCIRSLPVRPLRLRIEATPLRPETVADLERRLVVAFTGQARLAKNVLQIVVERYLRRDGRLLAAIRRLVELADEGRAALALGDLDDLGRVMDEAWHLHQHLDPHCSNPEVDALMAGVSDLARGAKLAGAGGGGFLGVMAKDAEAAGRIAKRLTELSGQIRVYNWSLSRR
jgi:fucokinase